MNAVTNTPMSAPMSTAHSTHLFILNDAPYGSERSYNALRLAGAMCKHPESRVRLFLMGDAVACAKAGQTVPQGYYNAGVMLGRVVRSGEVGACGTCMEARGITDAELLPGVQHSTLEFLAQWTREANKVLIF